MLITSLVSFILCLHLSSDVASPPENITIDGVWSRGISLTWTPSRMDGNSLITEYIIQYWKEALSSPTTLSSPPTSSLSPSSSLSPLSSSSSFHSNGHENQEDAREERMITNARMSEEEVSSSVTSHVIRDKLSPGSIYSLRMISKNSYGRGPFSAIVKFVTKPEAPSFPPTDISAESMGSTVIVIKWKPPPKDHWNGQLKGYRVGYRVLLSPASTTTSFTASDSSSSSQESSLAEVSVSSSSSSNSISSEPSNVMFVPPTNDPSLMEKLYSMKEVPSALISSEEQQLILTGLSKATTYSVIVQAFNEAGMGPFSQQVILSTSFNGESGFPIS